MSTTEHIDPTLAALVERCAGTREAAARITTAVVEAIQSLKSFEADAVAVAIDHENLRGETHCTIDALCASNPAVGLDRYRCRQVEACDGTDAMVGALTGFDAISDLAQLGEALVSAISAPQLDKLKA
jgi:hypothetical protein